MVSEKKENQKTFTSLRFAAAVAAAAATDDSTTFLTYNDLGYFTLHCLNVYVCVSMFLKKTVHLLNRLRPLYRRKKNSSSFLYSCSLLFDLVDALFDSLCICMSVFVFSLSLSLCFVSVCDRTGKQKIRIQTTLVPNAKHYSSIFFLYTYYGTEGGGGGPDERPNFSTYNCRMIRELQTLHAGVPVVRPVGRCCLVPALL